MLLLMPRPLRVPYPGASCHLMSRGDRGEGTFLDDVARVAKRLGDYHAGVLHREAAEAQAERIIAEERKRLLRRETPAAETDRGAAGDGELEECAGARAIVEEEPLKRNGLRCIYTVV
jgi:hypothetical protein